METGYRDLGGKLVAHQHDLYQRAVRNILYRLGDSRVVDIVASSDAETVRLAAALQSLSDRYYQNLCSIMTSTHPDPEDGTMPYDTDQTRAFEQMLELKGA